MRLPRLTLLLLLAACSPDPAAPAAVSAPIIGGSVDTGDPAVVALVTSGGVAFCTGTLISSKIVLTAGHCVDGLAVGGAYFGQSAGHGGQTVPAVRTVLHPEYDPPPGEVDQDGDVGVVVLRDRAGIAPIAPSDHPMEGLEGRTVRFVGFGFQAVGQSGGFGEKMEVSVPIEWVSEHEFGYGVATCNGDSGGPTLYSFDGAPEVVVGITSWGDETCEVFGGSARVDHHLAWIREQVEAYDPVSCEADFRCAAGCAAADPDCPCSPDDGFCSGLCLDPASDPDCPAGCAAGDTCVTICPNPDPDCGDPCGAEGHCLADCVPRDPDCPPGVPAGDACAASSDCETGGVCLADDDGEGKVCYVDCTTSQACAEGTCEAISAARSICRPAPPAAGGCAIGGGGDTLVLVVFALAVALLLRKRGSLARAW